MVTEDKNGIISIKLRKAIGEFQVNKKVIYITFLKITKKLTS
jgi:hypothetical protein